MQNLRTSRLVLEPQEEAHAEEMFRVLSDPGLYALEGAAPESIDWLAARFRRLESRRSPDGSEGWLNWVMRLQSSGELVGYVQATVHADASADVAYVLASRHWGKGLASEAVAAMLEELKRRHGVRHLSAVLKQANARSRRLLERLGFTPAVGEANPAVGLEPDEVRMVSSADFPAGSTAAGELRPPATAARIER